MADHRAAIELVLHALVDETNGVIKSMDEISAVGHRVVHGGEKYAQSVLIDDEVMKSLEECVKLAPLHNPPNIICRYNPANYCLYVLQIPTMPVRERRSLLLSGA